VLREARKMGTHSSESNKVVAIFGIMCMVLLFTAFTPFIVLICKKLSRAGHLIKFLFELNQKFLKEGSDP
jgi:hypothetical protein